jgi:hypothetical protein
VILKSGTNSIHGDVYEFARRTWLNANSWENDFYGYKKAQSKWDQYGFELDGPLVIPKIYNGKDKSFFTIQWEHFHALSPLTDTASIPNPAWATGDFSTLDYWTGSAYAPKTIYDPLTSVYNTTAGTPLVNDWVRTQFAGNKVPQGRLDAMAQKMLSYYPAPNVTIMFSVPMESIPITTSWRNGTRTGPPRTASACAMATGCGTQPITATDCPRLFRQGKCRS